MMLSKYDDKWFNLGLVEVDSIDFHQLGESPYRLKQFRSNFESDEAAMRMDFQLSLEEVMKYTNRSKRTIYNRYGCRDSYPYSQIRERCKGEVRCINIYNLLDNGLAGAVDKCRELIDQRIIYYCNEPSKGIIHSLKVGQNISGAFVPGQHCVIGDARVPTIQEAKIFTGTGTSNYYTRYKGRNYTNLCCSMLKHRNITALYWALGDSIPFDALLHKCPYLIVLKGNCWEAFYHKICHKNVSMLFSDEYTGAVLQAAGYDCIIVSKQVIAEWKIHRQK